MSLDHHFHGALLSLEECPVSAGSLLVCAPYETHIQPYHSRGVQCVVLNAFNHSAKPTYQIMKEKEKQQPTLTHMYPCWSKTI